MVDTKKTTVKIGISITVLVCVGVIIFFQLYTIRKGEGIATPVSVDRSNSLIVSESCLLYLAPKDNRETLSIDAARMRVSFDGGSAWGSLRVESTDNNSLSGLVVADFDAETRAYRGSLHLNGGGDSATQDIIFSKDDERIIIQPSVAFQNLGTNFASTTITLHTIPCPILEHTTQVPKIRNTYTGDVYVSADSELFDEKTLTMPLSSITSGMSINNGAASTQDSRVWVGFIPPKHATFMKVFPFPSPSVDDGEMEYAHTPLIWDLCIDSYDCNDDIYEIHIEFFDRAFKSLGTYSDGIVLESSVSLSD